MALTLTALDTFFRIDPRQTETILANGLPGTKGYKRAAVVLRTTVFIYYKRHSGDFYFTKVTVSLQKKSMLTYCFYQIPTSPDPSSRDTYFFSKTLSIASLNACLDIAPVATISSVSSNRFVARGILWNEGDYAQTYAEAESAYFMVLRQGTHHVGDLTLEVGESPSKLNNDSTWISFANPFPEGTTPVVIANITTRSTAYPFMVKIWNVTHEGFAVKLTRQAAVDASIATFPSQDIFYVAATPGIARMEDGKLLTVGYNTEDKVDGRIREVPFVDDAGNAVNLFNPYIICGPQTDSYGVPSVYRLARLNEEEVETAQGTATAAYSMSVTRQKDGTFSSPGLDNALINGDAMGWIAISDDMQGGGTGIVSAQQPQKPQAIVQNGRIYVTGTDHYSIYGLNGQMYPKNAQLPNGIYIVKAGETTLKVLVSGSK